MNNSDAHNPRRLIRAIEIAHAQQADPTLLNDRSDTVQVPLIYLQSDEALRERAIRERVAARFPLALQEIQALLSKYQLNLKELPNWQSLSSTGIKALVAYLRGEIDQSTCLENWAKQEIRYAKTQQLYTDKHVLY
jgi:tRNA A37 N6-isopentenylltransferase MiaA